MTIRMLRGTIACLVLVGLLVIAYGLDPLGFEAGW